MSEKNNFNENVAALFKGLDGFLTTKTVVGEAMTVGDQVMIPLADVSFGLAAGASAGSSKDNGGGGMGAKVNPAAMLIINKDGSTKLVSLKESPDALSKIVDMAPGLIKKFTGRGDDEAEDTEE